MRISNMQNEKGGENMSKSRTRGKQTLACVAAAVLALGAAGVLAPQVAAQVRDYRQGQLSLAPGSWLNFAVEAWSVAGTNIDRLNVGGSLFDGTILVKSSHGAISLGPCWRVRARVDFWLKGDGQQSGRDRLYHIDPQPAQINYYRWSAWKSANLLGLGQTTISDGGWLRVI
jgi:hypothetical protein